MTIFLGILIFFIIPAGGLTVCVLLIKADIFYDAGDWVCLAGAVILCAILFTSVLAVPISHAEWRSNINKYHALKNTIEETRESAANPLERVAMWERIAENNSILADAQYWNGTVFDLFIPDEIMELTPLK